MSYLVANPKDRFSRDEAQIVLGLYYLSRPVCPTVIMLFCGIIEFFGHKREIHLYVLESSHLLIKFLFAYCRFVIRKNSIWDKLVFRKIQNLLGGRVELVVTGSAPLESKVMDFLRCAVGCLVMF